MAHVLVVDDDPGVSAVCRLILEIGGHQVREATAGVEALDLLAHGRYDIVVLDLMMPGMDGYEVIESLRSDRLTRTLPVVILTAKTGLEDQKRSWREGACDYVTKPFPPDQLLSAVERAMASGPAERERRRLAALRQLSNAPSIPRDPRLPV